MRLFPIRPGSRSILAMLLLCLQALTAHAQTGGSETSVTDVQPRGVEAAAEADIVVHGQTDLCAPIFSQHAVTVQGSGSIRLSVVAQNSPIAKCAPGPHAYSVPFRLPALPAGSYAVSVLFLPPCDGPDCLAPPAADAGVLVAVALVVEDTATLRMAGPRAREGKSGARALLRRAVGWSYDLRGRSLGRDFR